VERLQSRHAILIFSKETTIFSGTVASSVDCRRMYADSAPILRTFLTGITNLTEISRQSKSRYGPAPVVYKARAPLASPMLVQGLDVECSLRFAVHTRSLCRDPKHPDHRAPLTQACRPH